jgi:hypothetical protein
MRQSCKPMNRMNTELLINLNSLSFRVRRNLHNFVTIHNLLCFHVSSIQFGCTTVINIPAEDPDADSVRCRLAVPDECEDACTSAPNITLNSVNAIYD